MHSRRTFLKLFGIAAASAYIPFSHRGLDFHAASQGRALEALTVFNKPDPNATVVTSLWPDSIVPILAAGLNWYRVPQGFIPRAGLQPMLPYRPDENIFIANQSFWAEVSGPVASIREYCGSDAPLVTRIGHGGVSKVVDSLPGDLHGWYGIEDSQGIFLGWTPANRWRQLNSESQIPVNASTQNRLLQIDTHASQLTVVEQGETILQVDCSVGQPIPTGRYNLNGQLLGGGVWDTFHGIPWQTNFGEDFSIAGVYWHNRFGQPAPGPSIQVTPFVARWIYQWLSNKNSVIAIL